VHVLALTTTKKSLQDRLTLQTSHTYSDATPPSHAHATQYLRGSKLVQKICNAAAAAIAATATVVLLIEAVEIALIEIEATI
jgi:hypothetical protein